jgi:hypothetical protein
MNARLLLVLPVFALNLSACGEEEGDDTAKTDDTQVEDTGPVEDCQPVAWTDGNSGTWTRNSAADDDVKHHWNMPADVHKLVASVTWETEWNMAYDLGTGFCPHSGVSYISESSTTGEIAFELLPSAVSEGAEIFDADVQWFAHMKIDMQVGGPENGESTPYTMDVLACTWVQ